jgi:dTDP-4-dehydrorhamnose 3,5-epimerase
MINKVRDLIGGAMLLSLKKFNDNRGLFYEIFNTENLKQYGIDGPFVQDNISISHKNVFRGMHYQASPFAQGKLVSVVKGSVLDIIVDIRPQSETFGKHVKIELTDKNNLLVWIPRGFAHGFLSLEDNTIFHYKVDGLYKPECERSINISDPQLNLGLDLDSLIISDKDRDADFMNLYDNN